MDIDPRRALGFWLVGLLTLGACSGGARSAPEAKPPARDEPPHAPTTGASGTPAASAPPPASAPPAASAASDAPPASAPPATSASSDAPPASAPEIRFVDHYPSARVVRLLAWKREHRASGPTFDQECWELGERVGSPLAPGLLCIAENRSPEFTLARIYRLEGTALREVWQATIATYMNWLALTPLVTEDGTLVLHDARPGRCRGAIAEYRAKLAAQKPPPSGELLEPACLARGKYAYERGRYRLVEPEKDWGPGPSHAIDGY